jgi:putative ABC transport system permease protein
VYFSYLQRPNARLTVALRVPSDVATASRELKAAVFSIDPAVPVFDLAMLDDRLASQLAPVRLIAILSSAYAGVALFLTAFGLFAILAHDVSQRVHEMGVRMALGAQRRDVLQLVLGKGIALTAAGLVVGMALSIGVSNTIEDFLFGVSPSDPAVYATVAALLLVIALLACWIPAHRATRVDPIASLRGESW